MEFLQLLDFDRIGSVAVLAAVALCVITDKLVWHTRLKKAEDLAERWEKVALDALRAGAAAGIRAAEVATDVVSALPDPESVRERAREADRSLLAREPE